MGENAEERGRAGPLPPRKREELGGGTARGEWPAPWQTPIPGERRGRGTTTTRQQHAHELGTAGKEWLLTEPQQPRDERCLGTGAAVSDGGGTRGWGCERSEVMATARAPAASSSRSVPHGPAAVLVLMSLPCGRGLCPCPRASAGRCRPPYRHRSPSQQPAREPNDLQASTALQFLALITPVLLLMLTRVKWANTLLNNKI